MDQGGKIRTGNILRGMKGGAFEVTLASPAPTDQPVTRGYRGGVRSFRVLAGAARSRRAMSLALAAAAGRGGDRPIAAGSAVVAEALAPAAGRGGGGFSSCRRADAAA